jgi:uncharacterized protein YjbI with pentapeptide repeats
MMRARFRSWWQKLNRHLVTILVIAIILAIAITLIIVGYRFDWTGFNGNSKSGKTLWDWLQLLIIPAVLAVGGYLFNFATSRTERDITADNQKEAALKEYYDQLAELLLEKKLRDSQPADEVRKIARVRTLTVLRRLDADRKGNVLNFVYESGLIDKDKPIIDLRRADLSKARILAGNLHGANLREANLSQAKLHFCDLHGANLRGLFLREADLREANMSGADLFGANLSRIDLVRANLSGANLSGAFLYEANLSEAKVTPEQLAQAASLKGATMPNGSIHP